MPKTTAKPVAKIVAKPEFHPKIEMVDIDKVTPYEKNPRIHRSGQIEKLAKSIREFGFVNPILVGKTGEIIAGHGRLKAAQKLDMKKVPIIRVEHLSKNQIKLLVIADNHLNELSTWDEEILGAELKELQGLGADLSFTGLNEIEIIQLVDLEEKNVLGDDPETPKQVALDKQDKSNDVDSDGDDDADDTKDSGSDGKKGFAVMAYCENYAQQLDAMNALHALGIKCSAK